MSMTRELPYSETSLQDLVARSFHSLDVLGHTFCVFQVAISDELNEIKSRSNLFR